jgi:hypothetical protein
MAFFIFIPKGITRLAYFLILRPLTPYYICDLLPASALNLANLKLELKMYEERSIYA